MDTFIPTSADMAGDLSVVARAEAVRLMRAPDTRAALGAEPQAVLTLRTLMQAVGLAA